MPNTPAQFPNYDLPGAEWFSLAPNANIAIQGRRRQTGKLLLNAVNPSGTLALPLETNFTPTSGVFVHRAQAALYATISSALAITCWSGLTTNANAIADIAFQPLIPAGYTPGNSTLNNNVPLLLVLERDILLTAKDLIPSTTWYGGAYGSNLFFTTRVTIASTAQVAVWLDAAIVYTRLDGFTE